MARSFIAAAADLRAIAISPTGVVSVGTSAGETAFRVDDFHRISFTPGGTMDGVLSKGLIGGTAGARAQISTSSQFIPAGASAAAPPTSVRVPAEQTFGHNFSVDAPVGSPFETAINAGVDAILASIPPATLLAHCGTSRPPVVTPYTAAERNSAFSGTARIGIALTDQLDAVTFTLSASKHGGCFYRSSEMHYKTESFGRGSAPPRVTLYLVTGGGGSSPVSYSNVNAFGYVLASELMRGAFIHPIITISATLNKTKGVTVRFDIVAGYVNNAAAPANSSAVAASVYRRAYSPPVGSTAIRVNLESRFDEELADIPDEAPAAPTPPVEATPPSTKKSKTERVAPGAPKKAAAPASTSAEREQVLASVTKIARTLSVISTESAEAAAASKVPAAKAAGSRRRRSPSLSSLASVEEPFSAAAADAEVASAFEYVPRRRPAAHVVVRRPISLSAVIAGKAVAPSAK